MRKFHIGLLVGLAAIGLIAGVSALVGPGWGETNGEEQGPPADMGTETETASTGSEEAEGNASIEWADPEDAIIRPGVKVASGACTSSFVFANENESIAYLGTAAHCVEDVPLGASVSVAGMEEVSTLVYSSRIDSGNATKEDHNAHDFALLRITEDHQANVSPRMYGFAAPTGIAETADKGEKVYTFGNSTQRDGRLDELDPREGLSWYESQWQIYAYPLPQSVQGDSGSGLVNADGEAVGAALSSIANYARTFEPWNSCAACNGWTRMVPALDYVNAHTDLNVHLITVDEDPKGVLPEPP